MQVSQTREAEVLVVTLNGRFDAQTAGDVEASLKQTATEDQTKVLVDMEQVEYISSAGLRVLLAFAKKISGQQGVLKLCSLKPYVQEVFEVAGFNTIFDIQADKQTALKAF